MYVVLNLVSVALKKSKSLCFASKEKFLKSDSIKSNNESIMKSIDGSENEGMCFLGWFLK